MRRDPHTLAESFAPHIADAAPSGPSVRITRRASDRLTAGHLWVYRSDVTDLIPEVIDGADDLPPGELVRVEDNRGKLLGTALYSSSSQIALRIVAPAEHITAAEWRGQLVARLRAAIARRIPMLTAENNAARLCFSEADQLPGLIIDRYASLVIVQLLTQGMATAAVREDVTHTLLASLTGELAPTAIIERPDPRIRELEDLPAPPSAPLYIANALARGEHAHLHHELTASEPDPITPAAASTIFSLNSLRFLYDANSGQKTGAFLDQRENYRAAAHYAATVSSDEPALDVCTYQGGFALHLAQVCTRVTAIDSSRATLEVAERNEELNRPSLKTSAIEWVQADAFNFLRDQAAAGARYSTIVLDPPAFAKSQRAAASALRGYKELNLRALQMLVPGGVLITCSCSHHVSLADFTATVAAAASDAHRRVTLLETRTAAPDHPVILTLPETHYLKCLICRVD
jgi:23S rRNA (cytosine1962-C5)-methyltransferase